MPTEKTGEIVMIGSLLIVNVQVTDSMYQLSRDYLHWLSTTTSLAMTETLMTAVDIITSLRISLR